MQCTKCLVTHKPGCIGLLYQFGSHATKHTLCEGGAVINASNYQRCLLTFRLVKQVDRSVSSKWNMNVFCCDVMAAQMLCNSFEPVTGYFVSNPNHSYTVRAL